ncbi:hypothetical protein HK104_009605 [Borealophlyctis nickersoniae]|nr:hypothetical protein HK104_009605 [Borealophlyctis nickersoniae]
MSTSAAPAELPVSARETAANMEILRKLVGLVARAYYEGREIIVLDILLTVNSMKDEDLAKKLKVQVKEVNRICGKLKMDGIIKVDNKWLDPNKEHRERRRISKSHYYIDYKHFVNVVKYKIYKIGKMIQQEVETFVGWMKANGHPSKAAPPARIPICDACMTEIEPDQNGSDATGTSEKYTKFMEESQAILKLLKLTDKMVIPEYVPTLDTASPLDAGPAISKEAGSSNTIVVEILGGEKEEKGADASGGDASGKNADGQKTEQDGAHADYYAQYYASLQKKNGGTGEAASDDEDENEVFETITGIDAASGTKRPAGNDFDDDDDEDFELVE